MSFSTVVGRLWWTGGGFNPKTFSKYSQKYSRKYSRNILEMFSKIFSKYSQNIPKIFSKYSYLSPANSQNVRVQFFFFFSWPSTYLALSMTPNHNVMGTSIGEICSDTHNVVYFRDRGKKKKNGWACFRVKRA